MDQKAGIAILGRANQAIREREESGGGPGYVTPRELAAEFDVDEADVIRLFADAVDAGTLGVGALEVYGR